MIPLLQVQPRRSHPSAELRHYGVSVESLAEAPEHLSHRIDTGSYDCDQSSMLFRELEYRSGLNCQQFAETFRNRNLAPFANAPFHSFILSDGHMVSR